jgi:glycerol kinase
MRKTPKGYGKQRFLSPYREPRFNRRFPFSSCARCLASCDATIEAHPLKNYVGAIDRGTTSTRFMVFDQDARVVAVAQTEHQQIYPQPGWVERDPLEILRRTEEVITEALAHGGLRASDLAAIGITNQTRDHHRLGTQNREANCQCHRLARHASLGRRASILHDWRPGLLPPANWLATQHLLQRPKTPLAGDLLFGHVDTFLLSNLTGGAKGGVHVTDVTNASRTQLLSLKTLD